MVKGGLSFSHAGIDQSFFWLWFAMVDSTNLSFVSGDWLLKLNEMNGAWFGH